MNSGHSSIMDSPMDITYPSSSLKLHSRIDSNGKRRYNDDSGYCTTPGSFLSSTTNMADTPESISVHQSLQLTPCEFMASSLDPTPAKLRRTCDSMSPVCGPNEESEAMEVCSHSDDLGSLSPELMKIIPNGLSPILQAASLTPKKSKPIFNSILPYRSRDLPKPRRKLHLSSDKALLSPRQQLLPQEFVDFVYYFGIEYNFKIILSEIFKYVADEDICRMTMVSKGWQKVCHEMPEIRNRWKKCVSLRRQNLENLPYLHLKGMIRSPLKTTSLNRRTPPGSPSSPPVSPGRFRFTLFRKAALTLKAEEQLVSCPRCTRPTPCTPGQNRGSCSWQNCLLDFCTNCLSPFHDPEPCRVVPVSGDTTPQKSRPIVILSAKSRRNLRRLL